MARRAIAASHAQGLRLVGSFVYGRVYDTFRRLYAVTPLVPGQRNAGGPARWQEIYGLAFDQLVAMWRNSLARSI